ncbi:MAG: hypothetical protein GWM92_17810 [Gemmatimonadetes bacterium]|nr:hypothetical protein [Gemmatimonadota bacterium]NIR80640.1 hypothetical protein [Gemmatimonadota bacterium]NIT89427.1 hypothetical protein [Gemmatimonadota bacterium]NIU33234.1 hypothetical protein [Gemmatimonadota bacterium]NIU37547.1 hypothetical protein [Gemmatimonadota bacterium]
MARRLYLFDDAACRGWEPFRLTRPAGELLFGCLLLRERIERVLGTPCRGHLAGEGLLGFEEGDAPPVVAPDELPDDETRILVSARWVAPDEGVEPGSDAVTLRCGDAVVGWVVPPGAPLPGEEALLDPEEGPETGGGVGVGGRLLEHPWDLVTGNGARIEADLPVLFPHSDAFLPARVSRMGDHPVSVGDDVEMEPGVVLDARVGPIRVEPGARLGAQTVLRGPAYVGRDTHVLGGVLSEVSLGPRCKVRGEVEASVVLGFSNKAHDGYLGHAYLGRWVNLGAMTTNSDLKNNYGPVRIGGPEGERDTGLLKLGCLLGDHAKTAIGTLLNTGTVVGAGSSLFGEGMPPKYVPPFSWGAGPKAGEYRIDDFLETAARVMARRDQELAEGMRDLLRRAWEASRPLRSP